MHANYVPPSEKFWIDFFTSQAQQGAGFTGVQYQRGAGIGNLFRQVWRFLLPAAASASKVLGREALAAGANFASDVLAGTAPKKSLKKHGKVAAANLLTKMATKMQGGGKRKKRKTRINRTGKSKKASTGAGRKRKRKGGKKRKTKRRKQARGHLGVFM